MEVWTCFRGSISAAIAAKAAIAAETFKIYHDGAVVTAHAATTSEKTCRRLRGLLFVALCRMSENFKHNSFYITRIKVIKSAMEILVK